MVNRVGATFVHRLMETTGATPAQVVRAYLLTRETFALVPTWKEIEALDNVIADEMQSQMLIELARRTVRTTTWFLRSRRLADPMAETIAASRRRLLHCWSSSRRHRSARRGGYRSPTI
jgi:glutamate dehydrogenase